MFYSHTYENIEHLLRHTVCYVSYIKISRIATTRHLLRQIYTSRLSYFAFFCVLFFIVFYFWVAMNVCLVWSFDAIVPVIRIKLQYFCACEALIRRRQRMFVKTFMDPGVKTLSKHKYSFPL